MKSNSRTHDNRLPHHLLLKIETLLLVVLIERRCMIHCVHLGSVPVICFGRLAGRGRRKRRTNTRGRRRMSNKEMRMQTKAREIDKEKRGGQKYVYDRCNEGGKERQRKHQQPARRRQRSRTITTGGRRRRPIPPWSATVIIMAIICDMHVIINALHSLPQRGRLLATAGASRCFDKITTNHDGRLSLLPKPLACTTSTVITTILSCTNLPQFSQQNATIRNRSPTQCDHGHPRRCGP